MIESFKLKDNLLFYLGCLRKEYSLFLLIILGFEVI